MKKLIVVIGAGSIGQAIARRVSAGKQVLLTDLRQESADMAAKVLSEAGFGVTTATVDVSSRLRFVRWSRRPRQSAKFTASFTPLAYRRRLFSNTGVMSRKVLVVKPAEFGAFELDLKRRGFDLWV